MTARGEPSKSFTFCSLPRPHQAERVEYPGRIVHIDRAVATLGGSAELAKQFSTKKTGESGKDAGSSVQLILKLGLASSQPNASDAVHTTALTGDSTASRGFLLCINIDDKGSASEANIVASYKRTHSFHRLADFVYRRDSPSAASYIATRGVINGASPSVVQVDLETIFCFAIVVTPFMCSLKKQARSRILFPTASALWTLPSPPLLCFRPMKRRSRLF